MFQRTNTIALCIYSLFASSAIARHAHRKQLHKHSPRSETTSSAVVAIEEPQQILTSSTLAAPSPSFTAADAVLEDLYTIQSGLNDLPEDLLAIISDLEHRLAEIEKFLAGYLDNGPALPTNTRFPAGPIGPVLSPAPSAASPTAPEETSLPVDPSSELLGTITVTIQSDPPATTFPATATAAAESDTTSFMKTRSTRITRTLTRTTTVPALRPTGIINSNGTLPVVNGTGSSFVPPAPWTIPYLASGFSSIVTVASTVEVDVAATPTI
ncbi:hypothetical protein Q7P36_005658 [Cladosporium allicinum]